MGRLLCPLLAVGELFVRRVDGGRGVGVGMTYLLAGPNGSNLAKPSDCLTGPPKEELAILQPFAQAVTPARFAVAAMHESCPTPVLGRLRMGADAPRPIGPGGRPDVTSGRGLSTARESEFTA